MTEARELVVGLWTAMETRDWSTLELVLAPMFRAEFPQSGERFDRTGFVRLNREYPGDWHIRVISIVNGGDCIVTEVEVDIDGRTDRAVSFFRVQEGKIVALREFWPEPFAAPEWRQGFAL